MANVFTGVAYNFGGSLWLSVLYGGLRRLKSAAEGSNSLYLGKLFDHFHIVICLYLKSR